MPTRNVFSLIAVLCIASQVGCCAMMNPGCGSGCSSGGCGLGGQVYNGGPSCGVADASCGCADVSCGCPDACGSEVGCGSGVSGRCPILKGLCRALRGGGCSSGCCGQPYCSEWTDSPPCECDPCDCYGNYTGGTYGSSHGRRAQMAKRHANGGLQFGEQGSDTIYR